MTFNSGGSRTQFIDAAIIVTYQTEPLLEKKPDCPTAFEWNEKAYQITEKIMEWVDYSRHGRMARNMSDAHSAAASSKGSWGVGRFYFRVKTTDGRIFEIYYDRAPRGTTNRKGKWFLFRELF